MKRSSKIRISAEGLRCFSTLPRCRCPVRPWITPPGSSAATAGGSAHAGASSTLAGRPCWSWPTCAKGETFAKLAAGFGIGTATAWRYVTETMALLAGRAPRLRQALRDASKAGHAYLVIDGTLIPIDRVAADRPFYSGKHRKHGMNLQVIASPDGDIVWVPGPLPGAVHDLTAARIWGIIQALAACGLVVLGDKGYLGEDTIRTPCRGGTSPPRRRTPTGLMPGCALPVSAPMPSSSPGASCASSAAAPGAPASWPRRSTSFKPAKSEDDNAQSCHPAGRVLTAPR